MDIARYSIENKVSSWIFAVVLLFGGIVSFLGLGRLEDPEFTIKQAMIVTHYPGASPMQVEEEVTYRLEDTIQSLPYVDTVTSISSAGKSQIVVEMKNIYRKEALKQIWDELRRKVNDLSPNLSPGVLPPRVIDDFGDVYGILLTVTGEDYDYKALSDYTDFLRRELVLIPGVGKVSVSGQRKEQIAVEISRNRVIALGLKPEAIYQILNQQNVVSNAGQVRIGQDSIRFHPSGEFTAIANLQNLVIASHQGKRIYLKDVANVRRVFEEIPTHLISFNDQDAIAIGVSFSSGVNVVKVGEAVAQRLAELDYARPVGMQVHTAYNQPAEVDKSVSGFVESLMQAILIVVGVLFIFMGARSGLLIGIILLLTVLGTFIVMKIADIELHRISLGALIIALGMLVDNAIVVAEGILIGMQKKLTRKQAASLIVKQTKWPLLGATVIAIVAFAPIGLSKEASGEFIGSLFWVLLISLMLSWITAISLTPFFASILFKESNTSAQAEEDNLYQGGIFTFYKALLALCLRHRAITLVTVIAMLVAALAGFSQVKNTFFPPSTTPIFLVDIWQVQGTDIRNSDAEARELEQFVTTLDKVEYAAATTGRGMPRFMLTYSVQKEYTAYSQLMVRVDTFDDVVPVMRKVRTYLDEHFSHTVYKMKRLEIGPSTESKIEIRFSGPEPDALRQLAAQAKQVLMRTPGAENIRDNWRQRAKYIRPVMDQETARRLGITKQDLDDQLLLNFSGKQVGVYRDGTDLLPILVRSPESERLDVNSLQDTWVYSPSLGTQIPITQVVSEFSTQWEDPIIMRRDRKRTLTVMADHDILGNETASALFKRIKADIEAIPLPEGYSMEWGGEYEASGDAKAAIFGSLPLGYLIMFVITALLFNSIKGPLVIWATVPLAVIGVCAGLLSTGKPFSFMALLGFLSLSGMLIKNGIVLLEQIAIEKASGKAPYQAVFDASVSRVRPVTMAAITTILGMIPLLFDAFFDSMAVTIMFGLGFATLLTLILVPVLYAMSYKIKNPA